MSWYKSVIIVINYKVGPCTIIYDQVLSWIMLWIEYGWLNDDVRCNWIISITFRIIVNNDGKWIE